MHRRGQHEGGRKSPIDSSSRPQWAARRMAACVGAMRAAKRDACKTAAMNAGEMAGGAHAASRPGPRRRAQSPFGRTAGRCRGKAARRWQHLRAMRDFGFLDAKEGPWRQDSRAMYPESPDCARKWMHGARMLPFRSRRACISGGCCQEGGLFRAFGEKGMHAVRFLPAKGPGPTQRERGTRAAARGGRDASAWAAAIRSSWQASPQRAPSTLR